MKTKHSLIFTSLLILLSLYSCNDITFEADPAITNQTNSVTIVIPVPEEITTEESQDDPKESGVACGPSAKSARSSTALIEKIEIPFDLPPSHDLSSKMPPVRSQGAQGSCVAWATGYYLKSYQEKIQKEYAYTSYEDVMSPAFVYNQSKANVNCGSGSYIGSALEVLKTSGCNTWKDFPYSEEHCSNLPSEELLVLAEENKIKDYFYVDVPIDNDDENYTRINLIKTLIFQKNPVVFSMQIDSNFGTQSSIDILGNYICRSYDSAIDFTDCGHAMLIVGYDDGLKAFKIVNSWGTDWANGGYCWVDYNFFLPSDDPEYIEGLDDTFVAFDADI